MGISFLEPAEVTIGPWTSPLEQRVPTHPQTQKILRVRQLCGWKALDEVTFEIAEVQDRSYHPNGEYFKVRTVDERTYLLGATPRLMNGLCKADSTEQDFSPGQASRSQQSNQKWFVQPSNESHDVSDAAKNSRAPFDCILADVLLKHALTNSF